MTNTQVTVKEITDEFVAKMKDINAHYILCVTTGDTLDQTHGSVTIRGNKLTLPGMVHMIQEEVQDNL